MFTPSTRLACFVIGALAWPVFAGVNNPPAAPVITEPNVDGQVVNFEDVHMETAAFSDPDPGQSHFCSDFEIWLVNPPERIWRASCVGGVLLTHIHLGDGVFENSHDGLISLFPQTQYQLRARHSDDSGDDATRWSPFSQRSFVTSAASQIFPLELDDIGSSPAPTLTAPGGTAHILPGGAAPPSIRVESAGGALLLEIRGNNGSSNTIVNPPALVDHVPVRVVMTAAGLSSTVFPALDLAFVDENGRDEAIYLPEQTVAAGQSRYFWVALGGATFVGSAGQTTPDFSTLARAAGVPWRVLQPGYRVDLFATGFQLPVNIAFVPNATAPDGARHGDDPYFYVAELYGTIKVVTHDGAVSDYATNLLNFNPSGSFPGSGELGLAGIVVDANGDVYATLLYGANPPNDGPLYPRVVRFTSTDGGRTAATQTTILDMVGESMGASHQISNISFGPDDKLYVHIGDGFNVGTALNLNSYRGKIIRLNRNGTAPTDNPFYSVSNGINSQDYIFAYGLRNPFGGAWRAADGQHYEVENGPSVDRFAQIVRGRNFGWNGTDASMSNFAIYNWDPAHAPVNIAFVQPTTFAGSGFPPAAQDRAFITESGPTWATGPQAQGKRITYFNLTPTGTLASGPTTLIDYIGNGKATAVALAAGPDGLYFSDLYKDVGYSSPIDRGANVLRVRYVGRADFSATRQAGCAAPFSVRFTDESDVPGVAARLWDFGDGSTSTEANPTHTYTSLGAFNVRLTVTGTPGAVSTVKSAYITVGPRAGLLAEYYDVIDLSGPPALVRDEPNIFYNWGSGSPDPSIGADTFSARWTGKLVPPQNGTYTIRTRSDDGVRVFLDDFAIINNWTDHGPTFDSSGPLLLSGGQEYDLRAEFYENGGGAVMELYWSGPFAEQPIPATVLRSPATCALVGDANCDGVVSVGDIGAFVLALTDPLGYAATFPDCPPTHADINGDGFVTVGDISGFVNLLTGG